tara:strand:+ start:240 stop:818 length:579 start_codon:yes stop_codon:yes gene_type:complete
MKLYRYFSAENHLRDFISGNIFMAALSSFSLLEKIDEVGNERHDPNESLATVECGGVISIQYFGNVTRVLCCSTDLTDNLRKNFGAYVVCIEDSEELASLLQAALADSFLGLGDLMSGSINYSNEPLDEYVFPHSILFSKPLTYQLEREYRFAFIEKDVQEVVKCNRVFTAKPLHRVLRIREDKLRSICSVV